VNSCREDILAVRWLSTSRYSDTLNAASAGHELGLELLIGLSAPTARVLTTVVHSC
jgi:hypothetical protein